MIEAIREVLRQHGRLSTPVEPLAETADLYQAGLSSHASVNLMLALEECFDIEFPERMLRRRTFESMAAMREAILELTSIRSAAG